MVVKNVFYIILQTKFSLLFDLFFDSLAKESNIYKYK